jgi:uncharacterized protein YybS (DUF2232 family)
VKAFIDWVLAQRLRPIVLAVVAAPLLWPVSGAFIALETARRDFAGGVICGIGVLAGVLGIAVLSGADTSAFAAIGVVCAVSGVGIGVLIRRAGNLVLAYQAAVLIAMLVVAAIWILGLDVYSFFDPIVQMFVSVLRDDETPPEFVMLFEQHGAAWMFAGTMFWQLVGTLLIGYWWAMIAARQRRFGPEFRRLALGRVLGGIATVVLVLAAALGLASGVELVQNLLPLALLGFVLQGIAVVHAWAHAKRWPPGFVAPLYVLLLMPALNVLVVLPLSLVGVVDNWFDLRALIRPQT